MKSLIYFLALAILPTTLQSANSPRAVDAVLSDYVKALGGANAVGHIESRVVHAKRRRAGAVTLYWKKPDLVLSVSKESREGYDGKTGWTISNKKKKVKRMARGAQLPLEMDANPLRYVDLKTLYSELDPAPTEEVDGSPMDVVVAPNNIAATKFFFDAKSHLLRRIEESGETSAYFRLSVDFLDYQDVDGIKFPFQIIHATTEPGGAREDLTVKQVEENVDLREEVFSKPTNGAIINGGRR